MIKAENIYKRYQKKGGSALEILHGISINIKQGDFISIMGASGSGKSTLMHILGCLDRATDGQYYFDNILVSSLSDKELSKVRNQKVGFVFQNFNLLMLETVYQNVELPLIYAGVRHFERKEKVTDILNKVGLSHRKEHLPTQLSGGECQRVAIARALVNSPLVIFADEPTGSLDSNTGKDIMNLFLEINRQNKTIVLVTHERAIAEYAQKIIQVKDGRIYKEESHK